MPALAALLCCAGVVAAVDAPRATSAVVQDIRLLADALIMTGTGMPVVDRAWMQLATDSYITPVMGSGYTAVPVTTPAQFRPFTGGTDMTFDVSVREGTAVLDAALTAAVDRAGESDTPTVVFGYSQSSVIATLQKRRLAERAATGQGSPAVSFVLLANPNRPNGGVNARFAGGQLAHLGWTFSGATSTDTSFTTIDVARQYDLFADFPTYPGNGVAVANAAVALFYGAHDYTGVTIDPDDPGYDPDTVVQRQGDTTYYFIPAAQVPLLRPLRDAGVDPVLVDAAEPAARVLVEAGYDRETSFGEPTPARPGPVKDPVRFRNDLTAAIKQGKAILETAKGAAASTQRPVTRVNSGVSRRHEPAASRPAAATATRSRR